jgi:hypothetical protein
VVEMGGRPRLVIVSGQQRLRLGWHGGHLVS